MIRLISALLLIAFGHSAAADTYVDVNAENLNFRDSNWAVIGKFGRETGKSLKVIGRSGKWLRVQDSKGRAGWVFAKYTTPGSAPAVASKPTNPVKEAVSAVSKAPIVKSVKSLTKIENSEIQSACIGDAKDPVATVYMHGWFKPNGEDTKGFRKLELNNREELAKMAKEQHIRIAAPLALRTNSKNGMAEWNGSSIHQLEAAAKAACGSPLAEDRTLLGFSSGGFSVNKLVCNNPNEDDRRYILEHYARRVALGTSGLKKNRVPTCGDIANIEKHVFPPPSPKPNMTDSQYLQALNGQNRSTYAAAEEQTNVAQ